jgi:hypothetical protein
VASTQEFVRREDRLNPQVQDQPGQNSKTLFQKNLFLLNVWPVRSLPGPQPGWTWHLWLHGQPGSSRDSPRHSSFVLADSVPSWKGLTPTRQHGTFDRLCHHSHQTAGEFGKAKHWSCELVATHYRLWGSFLVRSTVLRVVRYSATWDEGVGGRGTAGRKAKFCPQ